MFRGLSIKTNILGVLATLGGGYLLLLGVVQVTANATHNHMYGISTAIFPAAIKMQEAEASFERMKKHYGEAVVLNDSNVLPDAEKDAEATAAALGEVKNALQGTPELAGRIETICSQFSTTREQARNLYKSVVGSGEAPSETLMDQMSELGKTNTALSGQMSDFNKQIASKFQDELNAVDGWSTRSRIFGAVMFLFAMTGCFFAWRMIQVKVFAPLRALTLRLQDIAEGEGDLTQRIEIQGRNEIDEVGIWFNVFIERIEGIFHQVTLNAQTLGSAASSLAQSARETAGRASKEKDQAAKISAVMGEISTAIEEISKTTQGAANNARQAEQNALTGGNTVRTTVETILQLVDANRQTSTKVEELGRASNAIGKILDVINDIANQTNLLALNAAIEAARAGEHGRGFAVVAGEVRRLAERTGHATKEIDETIRTIQQGTTEVVAAMRSSSQHVEIGVTSARSAGEALDNIIHGSEFVEKMITQIAAAAAEQSYSLQSMSDNINDIASLIQQTAASSQESVESCQQLDGLAHDLSQLVATFKVRTVGAPVETRDVQRTYLLQTNFAEA